MSVRSSRPLRRIPQTADNGALGLVPNCSGARRNRSSGRRRSSSRNKSVHPPDRSNRRIRYRTGSGRPLQNDHCSRSRSTFGRSARRAATSPKPPRSGCACGQILIVGAESFQPPVTQPTMAGPLPFDSFNPLWLRATRCYCFYSAQIVPEDNRGAGSPNSVGCRAANSLCEDRLGQIAGRTITARPLKCEAR